MPSTADTDEIGLSSYWSFNFGRGPWRGSHATDVVAAVPQERREDDLRGAGGDGVENPDKPRPVQTAHFLGST